LPLRTLHKTLHTLRLRRHWQKETARKADNNFSIEKLANFLLADIHFNRKVHEGKRKGRRGNYLIYMV
jgi:hypothetical protein